MVKGMSYPVEVKEAARQMKLAGKTTKEIMDELCIKNKTQVKTWWKWYRNGKLIVSHKLWERKRRT